MSTAKPFTHHDVYMALATLELYVSITSDPNAAPLDEECYQSATEALAFLRSLVERFVVPDAKCH
jgi:hypothetical protein